MSNWDLTESTSTTRTWTRSWRQELFTDLGSDFRINCHMERVTTIGDGSSASVQLAPITRSASAVWDDPDVQLLNEVLTRLVKKWYDEDAVKARG